MMYQRDICLNRASLLAQQAEQEFDQRRKKASTPKKNIASSEVMITTMIPVAMVSLRDGQWTLVSLRTAPAYEFAGGDSRHVCLLALFGLRIESAPRTSGWAGGAVAHLAALA